MIRYTNNIINVLCALLTQYSNTTKIENSNCNYVNNYNNIKYSEYL